ncbi:hypothetical protein AAHA92_21898 [Salvia divinorum]|uniref:Uncharacterized protein n=1 Tax=Salvia divinorum TaxID=28513 RepID=A0ABD1GLY9_SALDI
MGSAVGATGFTSHFHEASSKTIWPTREQIFRQFFALCCFAEENDVAMEDNSWWHGRNIDSLKALCPFSLPRDYVLVKLQKTGLPVL